MSAAEPAADPPRETGDGDMPTIVAPNKALKSEAPETNNENAEKIAKKNGDGDAAKQKENGDDIAGDEPSADQEAGTTNMETEDAVPRGDPLADALDNSAEESVEEPGSSAATESSKTPEDTQSVVSMDAQSSVASADSEILLGPGEFLFELGCAYCLKRQMTMKDMLFHHQSTHPGPYKIFYVLRWWDAHISYWMCPLCEHVETEEGSSTVHHHAFLDHAREDICEPEPETPQEGVRSFVLQHWEMTLKELLRGRAPRRRLKIGEKRALDEASEARVAKRSRGEEGTDLDLEDDIPVWRQDLLTKTRVLPVDSLPARTWRTMVEIGTEQMGCSVCTFKTGLANEDVMKGHVQGHIVSVLYLCDHCQYSNTDIQAVVNHVAFGHREEQLEILYFKPPIQTLAAAVVSQAPVATREVTPNSYSDDDSQDSDISDHGKKRKTPAKDRSTPAKPAVEVKVKAVERAVVVSDSPPPAPATSNPDPPPEASDEVIDVEEIVCSAEVTIKDYLLVCAYCWTKAKSCVAMSEHFGESHKRQVRKVLYMVHNTIYTHSHWLCPLCTFVRDEDKKHMVQLHVFSKHGREDMLYPGLRYQEKEFNKYLDVLWKEKVAMAINKDGHVETDAREQAIMPRTSSGSILKIAPSNQASGAGPYPRILGINRNTSGGANNQSIINNSVRKVSSVSDQIIVVDDPTPDSDVTVTDDPDIIEVGRLTDQMQEVLQKAYTHTEGTKTCCNLCTYSAMGSSVVSHILEHVMLHLGDEIWLCPYCFIHKPRRLLMTGHVANIHKDEKLRIMRYIPSYSRYIKMLKTIKNIYVWICSLCSRKDTRKNMMMAHLRLGHPREDFSMSKLKKGFLIKIDEDKMKEILVKQNLKPRVRLHRVEDYKRHKHLRNLWDEHKVRVVLLPDTEQMKAVEAEEVEKDSGNMDDDMEITDAESGVATEDTAKDKEGPAGSKDSEKETETASETDTNKQIAKPKTGLTARKSTTQSPRFPLTCNLPERDPVTKGNIVKDGDKDVLRAANVRPTRKRKIVTYREVSLIEDEGESGSATKFPRTASLLKPYQTKTPAQNAVTTRTSTRTVDPQPPSHQTPKVIHVLHPLFCMYCDKINTRNIVQIKHHLYAVHPTEIPIARDIVTKAKKKPQYLYVCPNKDCYFITYSWSEMYDHLYNRHKGETFGFNLSKLPRNSRLPVNVRNPNVDHNAAITISTPDPPAGKQGRKTKDGKPVGMYRCTHCPYQTAERAYACLHVQIQHPDSLQAVKDLDGEDLYFCPLKHCSFGTHYLSLYHSHRCKDYVSVEPPEPAVKVKSEPEEAQNPAVYIDYADETDSKPTITTTAASSGPVQLLGSLTPTAAQTTPVSIMPQVAHVMLPGMPTVQMQPTILSSYSIGQPHAGMMFPAGPSPLVIQPEPQPFVIAPQEPEHPAPSEHGSIVIKPEPADEPATSGVVPVMMVENFSNRK